MRPLLHLFVLRQLTFQFLEWSIYSTVLGRFIMGKGITLFIGLILYLTVAGAFLLVFYGLVVIVFRNAFGIELPDPFHWYS